MKQDIKKNKILTLLWVFCLLFVNVACDLFGVKQQTKGKSNNIHTKEYNPSTYDMHNDLMKDLMQELLSTHPEKKLNIAPPIIIEEMRLEIPTKEPITYEFKDTIFPFTEFETKETDSEEIKSKKDIIKEMIVSNIGMVCCGIFNIDLLKLSTEALKMLSLAIKDLDNLFLYKKNFENDVSFSYEKLFTMATYPIPFGNDSEDFYFDITPEYLENNFKKNKDFDKECCICSNDLSEKSWYADVNNSQGTEFELIKMYGCGKVIHKNCYNFYINKNNLQNKDVCACSLTENSNHLKEFRKIIKKTKYLAQNENLMDSYIEFIKKYKESEKISKYNPFQLLKEYFKSIICYKYINRETKWKNIPAKNCDTSSYVISFIILNIIKIIESQKFQAIYSEKKEPTDREQYWIKIINAISASVADSKSDYYNIFPEELLEEINKTI